MKNFSFLKALLIIFPFGLIVLGVLSLFFYEARRVDRSELRPMMDLVTVKGLIEKQGKLDNFMSPRGLENEQELKNAQRTAAFVEGSLSPMNIGIEIYSEKAFVDKGYVWRRYVLAFKGESKENTQYTIDYLNHSNEVLATALELAESLPRLELKRGITITFEPIIETPEQGVIEMLCKEARASGGGEYAMYGIDWGLVKSRLERIRAEHQ